MSNHGGSSSAYNHQYHHPSTGGVGMMQPTTPIIETAVPTLKVMRLQKPDLHMVRVNVRFICFVCFTFT